MSAASAPVVKPLANYAELRRAGGLMFLSGMSARQADGTIAGTAVSDDGRRVHDAALQLRVILQKVADTLERHAARIDQLVDVTIFLTDMADYRAVNDEYNSWFSTDGPARTTVGVSALPHPDMVVELKVVAAEAR
ncbi:MAG TPA: RidA family protein [Ensifer sp.]|jgi:2-aminomuconate deaminase|uniref:RidA family protein n=1 Tax=Ensifer sp. TaxID=1872086 RepID=UPI002E12625E|nr:RidA family protein [Ensifer sp.]